MTSVVCGGAADHYCYVEAACLASCSAGITDGRVTELGYGYGLLYVMFKKRCVLLWCYISHVAMP